MEVLLCNKKLWKPEQVYLGKHILVYIPLDELTAVPLVFPSCTRSAV